mmetsp:Transcript_13836/g.20704  ORF Transcript_13836/g.20704 Transcript_13836/m.20704 type:complete len:308 (+) Transcript_13836:43-966(+)
MSSVRATPPSQRSDYWCEDDKLLSYANRPLQRGRGGIPKTMHFIWLGGELPDIYQLMIDSWRSRHPTWEVKLWDDEAAASMDMTNRNIFDRARNYGMKSDVMRYEVLYTIGGVYIDIDYECVGSLDDAVESCAFFTGLSNCSVVEVNNGIIGCVPGHPLMRNIIQSLHKEEQTLSAIQQIPASIWSGISSFLVPHSTPSPDTSSPIDIGNHVFDACRNTKENDYSFTITHTGPGLITKHIAEYIESTAEGNGDGVVIFNRDVFHPVPNSVQIDIRNAYERKRYRDMYVVSENTIAIHWWQRSWQKAS